MAQRRKKQSTPEGPTIKVEASAAVVYDGKRDPTIAEMRELVKLAVQYGAEESATVAIKDYRSFSYSSGVKLSIPLVVKID